MAKGGANGGVAAQKWVGIMKHESMAGGRGVAALFSCRLLSINEW